MNVSEMLSKIKRVVSPTNHELLRPLDQPIQDAVARQKWAGQVLGVVIDGPPTERASLVSAVSRLQPTEFVGFVDLVINNGWPHSGRREALPQLVVASSQLRPPQEANASIEAVRSHLEKRFDDVQHGQVAREIHGRLPTTVVTRSEDLHFFG